MEYHTYTHFKRCDHLRPNYPLGTIHGAKQNVKFTHLFLTHISKTIILAIGRIDYTYLSIETLTKHDCVFWGGQLWTRWPCGKRKTWTHAPDQTKRPANRFMDWLWQAHPNRWFASSKRPIIEMWYKVGASHGLRSRGALVKSDPRLCV